ncbi:MAG: hypothetical protein E7279_01390 [Lachnospiraceae bacterium]|nr:hypothetical protein [Lachnospiraceae bacterium]
MEVNLFCYLLGAVVLFVTSITLGHLRFLEYKNYKAKCVLSRIFFVLAGLLAFFPVVIFKFAKPDVTEQEYVYDTVAQSTDIGSITYKNDDGEVIEKDIDLLPKVYDDNGKNNYVASIRCYTGPFYVVRDCYVYTDKDET